MPVHYKIYKTDDTVCITFSGPAAGTETTDVLKEILADPSFKKGMNFLENRLRVPESATTDAVKSFVQWISHHEKKLNECNYARVAGKGSDLLMARMCETLAEFSPHRFHRVRFRAFTRLQSACTWLKIKNCARYA